MGSFDCRALTHREIATELAAAEVTNSRALPGATVYDLQAGTRNWLVIALPDGNGLAIDLAKPPPRRRRADTSKSKG